MKNYKGLWLLLASAFFIFFLLSAHSPVSLGSYEIKDSGLYSAIRPAPQKTPRPMCEVMAGTIASFHHAIAKEQNAVDTAAQVILFIGDSMLDNLGPRLAAYARHNGHQLFNVIWYSSHSAAWGASGKLAQYISRIKPTFIFICLGANELFVKDIVKKRSQHVENIIEEIGDLPYLWIGPPNWKPDTGINALIRETAGRGCFFLSDGMEFERSADGAHPTVKSSALWLDSVIRWMPHNHPHPIRLEVPTIDSARPNRVFVHQPSEIP